MKSVGEAMAIGRTFKESLQKALRSLEIGRFGLGADGKDTNPDLDTIRQKLRVPCAERIFFIRYAFLAGLSVEEVNDISAIDPWFLEHIRLIVLEEKRLAALPAPLGSADFRRAKKFGFSDRQLAHLTNSTEPEVRAARKAAGVVPAYRLVDTCAAEFEAFTPYYYSGYGEEDETRASDRKKS